MKIICIGRNYLDHAKELNSSVPAEPVFFMKPETAVVRNNLPFFIPDFSDEVHYELELVLKISRLGKNIQEKFAGSYYDKIGLGIDFTARDVQKKCIEKGLPWEIAKSFDFSAAIGKFVPKCDFPDMQNIAFHLEKNGKTVQSGNTSDMIFNFDQLISYVSRFVTLKMGDLLFTGTPAGVGPVKIDDVLEGYLEGKKLLAIKIK